MGSAVSSNSLEDYEKQYLPFSVEHSISAWDVRDKPKNYDYYFSQERITKISRKHYPRLYTKGWLYDYYYHPEREFEGEDREF